jgi:hypothetical protein
MFYEIEDSTENDFLKLFIWYESFNMTPMPMSYALQYTKAIIYPT